MGRGKTAQMADPLAKRSGETDRQWKSRLALARVMNPERAKGEVANDFAQQHGSYTQRFVTHVETATRAQAHVNRGGTPICRWEAAGKLTMTQLAVIAWCQRLWRLAGSNQRVTANYGERIIGSGNAEGRAANELQAREDLHRIQDYVPHAYWDVFENICRHSMAAGEAGVGPGYTGKAAQNRAHTIICFVADIVAMREGL